MRGCRVRKERGAQIVTVENREKKSADKRRESSARQQTEKGVVRELRNSKVGSNSSRLDNRVAKRMKQHKVK
jgi:hypothetical protein